MRKTPVNAARIVARSDAMSEIGKRKDEHLDLAAKGTIHNREVFNRNYFEELATADEPKFRDLVDAWVLEYAEMYSAKNS